MNERSLSYRLTKKVIDEHPEGLTARQVRDLIMDIPVNNRPSKQSRRAIIPHHGEIFWALKKMGARVLRKVYVRRGTVHSYANVYTMANIVPEGDTLGEAEQTG